MPFYERALGFSVHNTIRFAEGDEYCHMDEVVLNSAAGEGSPLVLLAYHHRPRPEPGGVILGIRVADVLEATASVIAAGGSVERELLDLSHFGVRNMLVRDPHGNILELLELTNFGGTQRADSP